MKNAEINDIMSYTKFVLQFHRTQEPTIYNNKTAFNNHLLLLLRDTNYLAISTTHYISIFSHLCNVWMHNYYHRIPPCHPKIISSNFIALIFFYNVFIFSSAFCQFCKVAINVFSCIQLLQNQTVLLLKETFLKQQCMGDTA